MAHAEMENQLNELLVRISETSDASEKDRWQRYFSDFNIEEANMDVIQEISMTMNFYFDVEKLWKIVILKCEGDEIKNSYCVRKRFLDVKNVSVL